MPGLFVVTCLVDVGNDVGNDESKGNLLDGD